MFFSPDSICDGEEYSSLGLCVKCPTRTQNSTQQIPADPNTTNSTKTTPPVTPATRSIAILFFILSLLVLFVVVALSVFYAQQKHGGTLAQGFYRSKEMMIFIVLTLQTASFVGPVITVSVPGAVTPMHRIIFGWYQIFTFDVRTISTTPPQCTTQLKKTQFNTILLTISFVGLLVLLLVSYKYQQNQQSKQGMPTMSQILKRKYANF